MATDVNARRTTKVRQPIAIGHLSDSELWYRNLLIIQIILFVINFHKILK